MERYQCKHTVFTQRANIRLMVSNIDMGISAGVGVGDTVLIECSVHTRNQRGCHHKTGIRLSSCYQPKMSGLGIILRFQRATLPENAVESR